MTSHRGCANAGQKPLRFPENLPPAGVDSLIPPDRFWPETRLCTTDNIGCSGVSRPPGGPVALIVLIAAARVRRRSLK